MDSEKQRLILLEMLRACFAEEICHLELRNIRDTQAPRFEALKDTHPEIYADFLKARNGPHEQLKKIRDTRIAAIKALLEKPDGVDLAYFINQLQQSSKIREDQYT